MWFARCLRQSQSFLVKVGSETPLSRPAVPVRSAPPSSLSLSEVPTKKEPRGLFDSLPDEDTSSQAEEEESYNKQLFFGAGRGPAASKPPTDMSSAPSESPFSAQLELIKAGLPDPTYNPPPQRRNIKALASWLYRNGVRCPNIVAVDTKTRGFGLYTTRSFVEGDFVAAVPVRLILASSSLRVGSAIRTAVAAQMRRLATYSRRDLTADEIAVLEVLNADIETRGFQGHVLQHMMLAADMAAFFAHARAGRNAFHPWAQNLDGAFRGFFLAAKDVMRIPGVRDAEEGVRVSEFSKVYRVAFEVLWALLPESLKDTMGLSRMEFAWGVATVMSHAIEGSAVELARGYARGEGMQSMLSNAGVEQAEMVPLCDLVNAPSADQVLPNVDTGQYVFKAEEVTMIPGLLLDVPIATRAATYEENAACEATVTPSESDRGGDGDVAEDAGGDASPGDANAAASATGSDGTVAGGTALTSGVGGAMPSAFGLNDGLRASMTGSGYAGAYQLLRATRDIAAGEELLAVYIGGERSVHSDVQRTVTAIQYGFYPRRRLTTRT